MPPEVYIPPAETPVAAGPRRAGELLPALFRRYVSRMAASDAELRHRREPARLDVPVDERTLPCFTIADATQLANTDLTSTPAATIF